MKTKTIAFVILAGLLTLFTTPVYAQGVPPLPHAFYGTVEVNGSPAPVGTVVEARGEGVLAGVGNNPIVITVEGRYGSEEALKPKLIVQGEIAEGAPVTFYVNGVSTGQTTGWHSGEVTELDLVVTGEVPPPEIPETPPETPETPPETPEAPPSKPAAFSLSSLIISPNEVALGETVTISVSAVNTGEEAGNCKVTLKIDGEVEASKDITIDAGASQEVIFTISKNVAKTYSVDVNGLPGTFVVKEEAPAPPAPPALSTPATPAPTAPAKAINWPVLWGVIGAAIAVGVAVFVQARRKARGKVY